MRRILWGVVTAGLLVAMPEAAWPGSETGEEKADAKHAEVDFARIDTAKDGTHESGKWKYGYRIEHKGTWSEQREGELAYDGKPPVEAARPGDCLVTPWGVMQFWTGDQNKGWLLRITRDELPSPQKIRLRDGPDETLAAGVMKRYKTLKDNPDEILLTLTYGGRSRMLRFEPVTIASVKMANQPNVTTLDDAGMKGVADFLLVSSALCFGREFNKRPPTLKGDHVVVVLTCGSRGEKLKWLADLGWGRPPVRFVEAILKVLPEKAPPRGPLKDLLKRLRAIAEKQKELE